MKAARVMALVVVTFNRLQRRSAGSQWQVAGWPSVLGKPGTGSLLGTTAVRTTIYEYFRTTNEELAATKASKQAPPQEGDETAEWPTAAATSSRPRHPTLGCLGFGWCRGYFVNSLCLSPPSLCTRYLLFVLARLVGRDPAVRVRLTHRPQPLAKREERRKPATTHRPAAGPLATPKTCTDGGRSRVHDYLSASNAPVAKGEIGVDGALLASSDTACVSRQHVTELQLSGDAVP